MTLSVVEDIASFENLAHAWAKLMPHADAATVFMQWEWHFTWWQVFAGQRDSLYIMTWWQGEELVGVLPVYKHRGLLPGTNCLKFIGTGESQVDEVATEYGDLLIDRRVQADVLASAVQHLLSFDTWQQIELMCMLQTSKLANALLDVSSVHALTSTAGQRYRVSLAGTEAEYFKELKGSRAKRIQRSQRALEREGGIVATPIDSIEDFDPAFRELAELNHERQAYKQRKSAFASSRFRHFHYELCLRLHDAGSANIVRFHLGSRLLAVLYCFYDETCCYYYQSGFTRKDANRYMPLTVAHLMEMQRNREHGRPFYDLMRGRPPCYKDEFSCQITPMFNVSVFKSRGVLRLVSGYRSLRSLAARLLKRQ